MPARRTQAFSLVELVLVVAILAVLGAIALPRFGRSVGRQRLAAAASRVAADLRWARSRAVLRSTAAGVVFPVAGQALSYQMFSSPDLDRGMPMSGTSTVTPAPGVVVTACDFGGDTGLYYDGFGVPDSGGSISIQLGEFTSTISVDAQTGTPTVTP